MDETAWFLLGGMGASVWIIWDLLRMPDVAFQRTGYSRPFLLILAALGCWLGALTLPLYLLMYRPPLVDAAHGRTRLD